MSGSSVTVVTVHTGGRVTGASASYCRCGGCSVRGRTLSGNRAQYTAASASDAKTTDLERDASARPATPMAALTTNLRHASARGPTLAGSSSE